MEKKGRRLIAESVVQSTGIVVHMFVVDAGGT